MFLQTTTIVLLGLLICFACLVRLKKQKRSPPPKLPPGKSQHTRARAETHTDTQTQGCVQLGMFIVNWVFSGQLSARTNNRQKDDEFSRNVAIFKALVASVFWAYWQDNYHCKCQMCPLWTSIKSSGYHHCGRKTEGQHLLGWLEECSHVRRVKCNVRVCVCVCVCVCVLVSVLRVLPLTLGPIGRLLPDIDLGVDPQSPSQNTKKLHCLDRLLWAE